MGEFTRAVKDPEFWGGMQEAFATAPGRAWDSLKDFGKIPERADRIAEEQFSDSARDSSRKNAFRHALGTGMMTQALGGNRVSAAAAKLAGYGWEGLGILDYLDNPEHRTDTRHDLNANAIGAKTATEARTQEELVRRLKALADASRKERPPLLYEGDRGHLTHTER